MYLPQWDGGRWSVTWNITNFTHEMAVYCRDHGQESLASLRGAKLWATPQLLATKSFSDSLKTSENWSRSESGIVFLNNTQCILQSGSCSSSFRKNLGRQGCGAQVRLGTGPQLSYRLLSLWSWGAGALGPCGNGLMMQGSLSQQERSWGLVPRGNEPCAKLCGVSVWGRLYSLYSEQERPDLEPVAHAKVGKMKETCERQVSFSFSFWFSPFRSSQLPDSASEAQGKTLETVFLTHN